MDEYSNEEGSEYNMSQIPESIQPFEPLWRVNDKKAQKNGPHRSIYWVGKRKKDGKMTSTRYFI